MRARAIHRPCLAKITCTWTTKDQPPEHSHLQSSSTPSKLQEGEDSSSEPTEDFETTEEEGSGGEG